MFDRIFLDHPKDVGESYAEHARIAARFGLTMVAGGLACIVHAAVPVLFTRTASSRVARLHAELSARRAAASPRTAASVTSPWAHDYQI